jgi:hypothetical protein
MQSRDPEEKAPLGRHPEPLFLEDLPQPVPVRKHPQALGDIPVNLRCPVEEESPEAAPASQQKVLQMPEEGTLRIRKVEERRNAAG